MNTRGYRSRVGTLAVAIVVVGASVAGAAWLRPVEGGGNFHCTVDLANFQEADGRLDVVVMVAIENREIEFERVDGRWQGKLHAVATLSRGADDSLVTVTAEADVPVHARSEQEAGSPTLTQIFTLVLRDVPFHDGTFQLDLNDLNRRRPVFLSFINKEPAFSQAVADWSAPPEGNGRGLVVGDLVFLAHAPIAEWSARAVRPDSLASGGPWDYLHPLRRYGLEQTQVQVYFELQPPHDSARWREASGRDLLVEVLSKELDFALRDTLSLTPTARQALAAGRPAAIYYQLDGSLLPPGAFRLGIAPLDSVGRGYLGEFDVTWRLDQVARGLEDLLGEGHTVLRGEQLRKFDHASRMEQEVILDRFWQSLDPDRSDPYNEVYAEFRRRVSHVREHLGGFGAGGARDARGRVYLLLGPPDEIQTHVMPLNESDLEDARVKVYEPYAPDREGTFAKGNYATETSASRIVFTPVIPMPYSFTAAMEIQQNKTSVKREHGFELWRYTRRGDGLFPNAYSDAGAFAGLRFLFVDSDGTGRFELQSSNAFKQGD